MVANWMDFIKSERSYDSLKRITIAPFYTWIPWTRKHPAEGDIWMAIDKFLTEIETGQYSVDEDLRSVPSLT